MDKGLLLVHLFNHSFIFKVFILIIIIAHHHQLYKYSAVQGTVKLGFDGVKNDYLGDLSIVLWKNRLWYSLLN